jgi:3D-(3,5/4)-trihydroxycyclohexane-1,2-dione acylhydrolase (decyclizing)
MMAVTSSIGPGATNMVTAAAVAHVNRLPLLLLPGDVFANRRPDPVLQQIENFADGTVSANDCFRPVSRYFDRITRPEQIITALQRAAVSGRSGRGVRLSRGLLRRAHLDPAPRPSVGGRT